MADSKAISIRLPDELLAKVNKLAEEKYKSIAGKPNKSLVVQNALIVYFNTLSDSVSDKRIVTENDTVSIDEFNELQNFVVSLSKDVEGLKNAFTTSSDTVAKTTGSSPKTEQEKSVKPDHTQLLVLNSEEALTTTQLAKRFGVKPNDITSKKYTSKAIPAQFVEWSKAKDPEGQAWEFRKDSKLFYRVLPTSLSEGGAEAQSSHP
jgi:hypothetical protein